MTLDESGDSADLQDLFDNIAGVAAVKAVPAPPPSASGDSDDLQDLFDSVASTAASPAPAPAPVAAPVAAGPAPAAAASGDSDDLQALFDNVAAESVPADPALEETENEVAQEAVFNNLGKMARQLHDSLRELGYDQSLKDAATQIPDARQRLTYIAQMTEQAASRVLNATDIAKPITDEMQASTSALSARWERMFANQLSVDEFKALAADSRAFFSAAPVKLGSASQQLNEIMMAQDFQDLTGQVIKRVVEMTQGFEQQLIKVLVEAMPEKRKVDVPEGLMNGPVISAVGRDDVVTDQAQVDDLLESLGF